MSLPAPLQPLRCNNPDCTLSEGGRCARLAEFPNPLVDCVDLARVAEGVVPSQAEPAPWSGRHLDSIETERLLWRSPARLIAVLGPTNAGKTSLLTSFFLQFANGQRATFPYRFASSLTLHGFRELVERANQWTGQPSEDIVLHTIIGAEEASPRSFLHLGLRPANPADDRHVDVLLSDIPGEWVRDWTGQLDETTRSRLRFISRCDAFIVLADAGALMEQGGGRIDNETSVLIRRITGLMKDATPQPSIALVLSKFDRIVRDVPPPAPEQREKPAAWGKLADRIRRTWVALDEARRAGLPVEVFPVSAFPNRIAQGQPVGVVEPFTYAMQHADRREPWPMRQAPIAEDAVGFATLRRWGGTP